MRQTPDKIEILEVKLDRLSGTSLLFSVHCGHGCRRNRVVVQRLLNHCWLEETQPSAPQREIFTMAANRVVRIASKHRINITPSNDTTVREWAPDIDEEIQNSLPMPWPDVSLKRLPIWRDERHTGCRDREIAVRSEEIELLLVFGWQPTVIGIQSGDQRMSRLGQTSVQCIDKALVLLISHKPNVLKIFIAEVWCKTLNRSCAAVIEEQDFVTFWELLLPN